MSLITRASNANGSILRLFSSEDIPKDLAEMQGTRPRSRVRSPYANSDLKSE
jgi:hypothetical protein